MSPQRARVAVVTGGSRGIGRAIAERLRRGGYAVAACSRTAVGRGWPASVWHARVDVRRRTTIEGFIRRVVERFGRLDVLVNCAGVSRWRALEDVDEAFVAELLETNVMGTVWACKAAARHLQRGGSIVNVSSLAGKRGSANNSIYCASKFAVNGLTQALAKELGPRGIRVNAVCPVYVETERILSALAEPAAPPRDTDVSAYLADFASSQTALGRLPRAEEVAETVWWLAGPSASAVTGQCLNVDCGTLPQ